MQKLCSRKLPVVLLAATLFTLNAQTQDAPRRAAGNSLVARLETKLGKALTDTQEQKIAEASQESAGKLKALQAEFVGKIVKAVTLPEADIQPMMPKIGESNAGFDKNMIPKLETKLGRKLTADELATIRAADNAKKSAMKPVQKSFAERLAGITGLKAEDIQPMLPKVGL
jgi:hypothetical protein